MTLSVVSSGAFLTALLACGSAHAAVTNYQATLNGTQESPVVTTAGAGTATFSFDDVTNVLTGTVTYAGLSGAAISAHIHQEAACTTGGVIHSLTAASPIAVGVTLAPAEKTALASGLLYVNIHSPTYPLGEIRGQILPLGQAAPSCGDAGVPPPVDGGVVADSGATQPGADGGSSGGTSSGGGSPSTSSGGGGATAPGRADDGCSAALGARYPSGSPALGAVAMLAVGALLRTARRRRGRPS